MGRPAARGRTHIRNSVLVFPSPPHSFPLYFFRFPAQTQFSNWDFKAFQFKFYQVKVLRSSNKDCHIVGCTKLPIPPTRQESLF